RYMYWLFLSNYNFSKTILPLTFLWSIAVEEQFYLLFLALSFFFKKRFGYVLLFLFLVYILYSAIALRLGWNNNDALGAHLIMFCSGMTCGWLFFHYKLRLKYLLPAFVIASVGLFFVTWYINIFNTVLSLWLGVLILTSIPLCIFLRKTYPLKLTEFLGKYTYGLYVYSGFIIIFGTKLFPKTSELLLLPSEFILLFIVSFLSYHFFEKRFLKLKEYFRKQPENRER
ncbi:MAG: acyltransferase family protein, partial [Gillisia sp.]